MKIKVRKHIIYSYLMPHHLQFFLSPTVGVLLFGSIPGKNTVTTATTKGHIDTVLGWISWHCTVLQSETHAMEACLIVQLNKGSEEKWTYSLRNRCRRAYVPGVGRIALPSPQNPFLLI
jgi:hypothetical protein